MNKLISFRSLYFLCVLLCLTMMYKINAEQIKKSVVLKKTLTKKADNYTKKKQLVLRPKRQKLRRTPVLKEPEFNQSPINLSKSFALQANLKDVEFNYNKRASLYLDMSGRRIKKEGQRVAMRVLHDNFILVDGKRYRLEYIDFKTPSEHVVEWNHFPAEMQFVHKNKDGEYVVLAVFIKINERNYSNKHVMLERLIKAMTRGEPRVDGVRLLDLFPKKSPYYCYNKGSLTTKPYTNAVWFIYTDPILVGEAQLWDIEDTIGGNNNRDVRLPDDREVFFDHISDR